MGRWGAAELECLSTGCSQVVGDGEAELWAASPCPQRGFGLMTVLWVVLAKMKMLGEDGSMVWLWLPGK